MYPSNCVWCYFILAVMALPRDPRWTASNHIPESLHGTSQRASCLFAKHPSECRCQSPEGNEHLLFFPLRWEEGIIPVTQIRKLSLIQGVRMKSVLFWKLLFLHYMCLSENQRMQGNIEDHHSQSPPPLWSRDWETSWQGPWLGLQSQDSSFCYETVPVLWRVCLCLCWGCIGKESEDEGRPRLGTKELSRQLEMPEFPS